MNVHVNHRSALLIGATDTATAALRHRVRQHRELDDFDITAVIETEALTRLSSEGNPAPAVIILDMALANPGLLLRKVHQLQLGSSLLFVHARVNAGQPESTPNKLELLPLSGLFWRAVDPDDGNLPQFMADAARAAQQRRRFRSTVSRANQQISEIQRKQLAGQSARSASDYYLANFLAHAEDAIVALDTHQQVIYWSAGAIRLFGGSDAEVVGRPAQSLVFWSAELEAAVSGLQARADTLTTETGFTLAGEERHIESVCSMVRDDNGRVLGTSLVIRDVTARTQQLHSERAAQSRTVHMMDSERRRLRSLFAQAPGFIAVMTGSQHRFDLVNEAYLRLIGRREVVGKPAVEALPEIQGQQFLTLLDQVYLTGEPYIGRGIAVAMQRHASSALETLYVDFVFQPILDDDGLVSGIFCQGNDVTGHRLTQESLSLHQTHLEELVQERTRQLEASQSALQRSQKLEAIGQLTGGVAHDFNNVLQIIASNLQLLQLDRYSPDLQQKYLHAAIDAVDRGTRLSTQLLAFARRQPLQPASINLSRVMRGMGDLLRRAIGETIEMETVVAGGLWNTSVDANRLENVILNLCINARDAMPEGGRLTLELGNAMLDDQYVLAQPDVPAGQYVLLAVSDTGTGMSREVIERAFDPFFSTKAEGEGTGLGLSMAYGFIKQSGGHIRIYSEPDCGTTIKIYLPRCYEVAVELAPVKEGPVEGGAETVLVVENDSAVRKAAVLTLKDLGYHVLKAADGQSALNVLQSGVHVDVLFTDVVMPGPLRSPQLAEKAKQLFPDIAVLFTSGYTQNAIVHGGRLDPGVELLSKPYRREDLARKIRQVMVSAAASGVADEPLVNTADQPADRFNILVVEDELESQEAICRLLVLLGHTVNGVASAEEALEFLHSTRIDLLLTDINLPQMSGLELARAARRIRPDICIIFASGYGASADGTTIDAPPDPAPLVLPKPFGLQALQQALQQCSERIASG